MRIASMDSAIGYRLLPINLALKEALESLYLGTWGIWQM